MNCTESLGLLSDYHDGELNEVVGLQVRAHLDSCVPCLEVFSDLGLIVVTAVELRYGAGIEFPDEAVLWRRLEGVCQK
jgi:hypothetical protein